MDLGGLQRTTLSDFPDRIACTVFSAGCNLRCPYCHNPELLDGEPSLPEEQFFAFLDDRTDVLEGVVISGGEPTLQADLPKFIERIADRGFDVKLDTNGTRPEALRTVLETGLIDYVAMDIKTSPGRYDELGADVGDAIERSAAIVRTSDVDYEFRTTFERSVVEATDFRSILEHIGEGSLSVQPVRTEGVLDPERTEGSPDQPLEAIREALGTLPNAIDCRTD